MRCPDRLRRATLVATAAVLTAIVGCGSGSGRSGTDLQVSGTGPVATVAGGSEVVFEMQVKNAGEYAAEDVAITNEAGGQLSLMGITCTAEGGAVCPEAPSIAMRVPSLKAGGTLRFTVTTLANPSARGTLFNRMAASFAYETDSADNVATVTATAYSPSSDLVVIGSGPAGTVTGGDTVAFDMSVRNEGPDDATGVRVLNEAGSGLVVQGIACTASGGATCPAVPGALMDVGTLPAGGSLDFVVTATVAGSLNGIVTNTLQVSADADSDRLDNSFTAQATVVTPRSGVFVTGVGPAGTVAGGGVATFVMTVGNAGPDASGTVNIVDTVGARLTLTAVRCTATAGASCPTTLGPVMSVPTLPAGAALQFEVDAVVDAGTTGLLTNAMSATAANDADRTDNTATAVATASTPRAVLTLSGTGPADPVAGGGLASFDMKVVNTGPDPATGLRLRQTPSGNLSLLAVRCSAAGGAVCPGSVGVVTEVPSLPVGGQLTLGVDTRVDAGANGAITNTLLVTGDNVFAGSGNSVIAVGTAVSAVSGLTVTGSAPASAVPAGSAASFRMAVVNDGPDAAGAVRLTNAVGGNLTLTDVRCVDAAGGATCPAVPGALMDLTALPVGASVTFDVTATVAAGTQGAIVNTLTATTTAGGATQQASGVAVGSAYAANVTVTGSGPAGSLVGGASGEFLMEIANAGPGTALGVDVEQVLSAGLSAAGTISCVQAVGATCPTIDGASFTVPSLPANGRLRLRVPFTVDAGTNGTVSGTMTTRTAGDPRPGDDSATVGFLAVSTDLSVSQVAAPALRAGETASFTAVVANPGTQAVGPVVITQAIGGAAASGLVASVTCTPSVAATCPAIGPSMTVASLPARSTLSFVVTVLTDAGTRGALTNTFSLTADGDPDLANNTAATTVTVGDPRNGAYKAVATDGNVYDLSIDFDAGQYTMAGAGAAQAFGAPVGSEYTVGGAIRFRVAEDLLVGAHDFGAGATPYVAVRNLVTTLAEAAGTYFIAIRDLPAGGSPATRATAAIISGNQMAVCSQAATVLRVPGPGCPSALAADYTLAVSNGVFTATPTGGGSSFRFFVARSGGSTVLVGATGSGAGGAQMRIGLPSRNTLIGGTLGGASTSGAWLPTLTITPSSYLVTDAGTENDSATIGTTDPAVQNLRSGPLASGNGRIWVMQAAPLAVTFGNPDATGAAAGRLQIVLPP
ncbi:MAG: hypothetical protein H6932_12870 [Burkholderiaceae bacterium]|nr:hypothetical protein [Burkholderiaceae bacterium]